jgi:hypothetical protein
MICTISKCLKLIEKPKTEINNPLSFKKTLFTTKTIIVIVVTITKQQNNKNHESIKKQDRFTGNQ